MLLAPANWQTYPSYVGHVPAETYERQRPSRWITTHLPPIHSPLVPSLLLIPLLIYINSSSYFRSFNPLGSACERTTRMEHASSTKFSPSRRSATLYEAFADVLSLQATGTNCRRQKSYYEETDEGQLLDFAIFRERVAVHAILYSLYRDFSI